MEVIKKLSFPVVNRILKEINIEKQGFKVYSVPSVWCLNPKSNNEWTKTTVKKNHCAI